MESSAPRRLPSALQVGLAERCMQQIHARASNCYLNYREGTKIGAGVTIFGEGRVCALADTAPTDAE